MYSELLLRLKQKEKEHFIDNDLYCPKCKSVLIRRKSKFSDGYWYGCSDYPGCKYLINEGLGFYKKKKKGKFNLNN